MTDSIPLCDVVPYVLTDGRRIVPNDETLRVSTRENKEWGLRDLRMVEAKASVGYP